jgi:predicted phage tail protein
LSCGKKGPLKLEPVLLPLEVEQFKLTQVGGEILLQWVFPQFLSDKKTKSDLESITKIYIYYSGKDIPAKKFKKKSLLLKKRNLNDLVQKENAYSLNIPFKVNELDDKTHYFAVLYSHGKKKSTISKIESIKTIIPVKPVNDLKAVKENKLVKLKWSKPELNQADKKIRNISGYNVSRKIVSADNADKKEGEFIRLNKAPILQEYYEDNDTGVDGEYLFYVSTISSNSIESDPSNTASLTISDTFPPDPPQNLVAFKHKDHLFLTWEKVAEKDLAHYKIYRKSSQDKDDEFKAVADKIKNNYFKDTKVSKNTTYSYYAAAIDAKGNESSKSNIVKEKF